jgi:hypothetical protein
VQKQHLEIMTARIRLNCAEFLGLLVLIYLVQENKLLKFLGFMWNPLSWVMESAALMAIVLANGQVCPTSSSLINLLLFKILSSILGEGTPFGCSGYLASAGPLNPGTPSKGFLPQHELFKFQQSYKMEGTHLKVSNRYLKTGTFHFIRFFSGAFIL